MPKALVVFATRTGETENIGKLIAEGLRFSGVDVDIMKAGDIKNASELNGYDALVCGGATSHGDRIQGMKTFLFLAEKAELEGKAGGAFGAFGWSGEAPGRIFDTMSHIMGMDMVSEPLRLKSAAAASDCETAREYGSLVAAKLQG